MFHKATGKFEAEYDMFRPTNLKNPKLEEAVHVMKEKNESRPLESFIAGFLLMSAKAGIKKHGKRAIEALLKEFTQLNDKDTFEVTDPKNLTYVQKKKDLKALSIVTEKRDESLKGRTCADGRKQRQWKTKAESASPTAHTDSVLLTSVVDAHDDRS